jgi:hypothetical protein
MDCNEKDMFYTNDAEYAELLGIGKPQGFLGLKKLFNTKGYQNSLAKSKTNLEGMSSIMSGMNLPSSKAPISTQSSRIELTPIQSVSYKPLSVDYGTPTPYTPKTFTPVPTSSIDTSKLFSDILDTAIVFAKNKAQQGIKKTETKEETTTTITEPVVNNTTDNKGYSKDPRGNDVKPDRTMLYVGLAGAGILLISGIAFMASKGK